MAADTKIEWAARQLLDGTITAGFTFNPWIGCTEVSPACDHCYARALMEVRHKRAIWGAGEDRARTSSAYRRQPHSWNRVAAETCGWATVFCLSLGDVWDVEVDDLWRYELMQTIEATPALTWLLLSKRIGNAARMTRPEAGHRPLPANAALGATMVNQKEWDRDAAKLEEARQRTGAKFTFASVEPMLEPMLIRGNMPDWVICGGESGPGARDWDGFADAARALRDQCAEQGTAFFMKQMPKKRPIPADLLVRQFPPQLTGSPL